MATWEVSDASGEIWEVDDGGQDPRIALSKFKELRAPKGQPQSASDGFKTAEKAAGGLALLGGIGAPVAAIAGGAPALPVLAGLAGGTVASMGADALLNATGAKPALNKAAQAVRGSFGGVPEARTQSVPLNFAINAFREVTDPRAGIANALEALPLAATAYAGMKGGEAAVPAAQMVKTALVGTPKVAKGQEGSTLLALLAEKFGVKAPQAPANTGEFRQGLGSIREQLGAQKGDVQRAAFAGVDPNADTSALAKQAIESALAKQGVNPAKPDLATSPEAAKALLQAGENVAPQVTNIQELQALKQQMAAKGAQARKPTSPTSNEAPYYETAANQLKQSISDLIPQNLREPLAVANKDFAAMKTLEGIARKASRNGEFSPERMVAEWKSLDPKVKARINPETLQALEALFKQGGAGILGRMLDVGRSLANFQPGTAVKQLVGRRPLPVRFNAPQAGNAMAPGMAGKMGLAGAAAPTFFQSLTQSQR